MILIMIMIMMMMITMTTTMIRPGQLDNTLNCNCKYDNLYSTVGGKQLL